MPSKGNINFFLTMKIRSSFSLIYLQLGDVIVDWISFEVLTAPITPNFDIPELLKDVVLRKQAQEVHHIIVCLGHTRIIILN